MNRIFAFAPAQPDLPDPGQDLGREVHCIGIDFSKAKRSIVAWEMA